MKLFALILVVLMTAAAFAATSTEVEWTGEGSPTFWAIMSKNLGHSIGVFINVNASENWGQAYAGPTFTPAPWCQIGIAKGFETFGSHERIGGYVWVGRGPISACAVIEDGASGPWHRYNLDYQLTKRLALGLVDKAYTGQGPTLTYTVTAGTKIRLNIYDETGATLMLQQSF